MNETGSVPPAPHPPGCLGGADSRGCSQSHHQVSGRGVQPSGPTPASKSPGTDLLPCLSALAPAGVRLRFKFLPVGGLVSGHWCAYGSVPSGSWGQVIQGPSCCPARISSPFSFPPTPTLAPRPSSFRVLASLRLGDRDASRCPILLSGSVWHTEPRLFWWGYCGLEARTLFREIPSWAVDCLARGEGPCLEGCHGGCPAGGGVAWEVGLPLATHHSLQMALLALIISCLAFSPAGPSSPAPCSQPSLPGPSFHPHQGAAPPSPLPGSRCWLASALNL